MVETTRIGSHLFYNSKAGSKAPIAETAFVSENDGLGLLGPEGQFGDLLKGEEKSEVPNPDGKGLARLVRELEEKENSGGGKLNFVHLGQEKIAPQFAAILTYKNSPDMLHVDMKDQTGRARLGSCSTSLRATCRMRRRGSRKCCQPRRSVTAGTGIRPGR
ncbi:hypothetical protein [Agrobacterium larrymoorei]|uniref:hypothetical protein n=1 Tax=Agrobacterium larrymoorei TaxID=160699 RepID=UPI0030C5B87A